MAKAKEKKELPVEPILSAEVDSPQLQQAKIAALEDEVLRLSELLDRYKGENDVLRTQVEQLRSMPANSASINPPPPAPPVRPVVEIGGEKYRFKVGETRLGRKIVASTAIASDETLLAEVFGKYPGLFEKL